VLGDGRRLLAADVPAQTDAAGRVFYDCSLTDVALRLTIGGGGPTLAPGDRRTLTVTNIGQTPVALAEALVQCEEAPAAPPPIVRRSATSVREQS